MSFAAFPAPLRAVFLGCLGILLVHWLNQLTTTFGLQYDEAQYWFWGKHPALGYYSKPPLIAWAMAASTALFGDGTFGVRMLSPLLQLGAGTALYHCVRLLGRDRATAAWVLITYLTLPIVTGASAFFTTDSLLLFFWACALYTSLHALLRPQQASRWWLLTGLIAGLGLLSKYTFVGFAASVGVALLMTRHYRQHFRKPWVWLGGLLALIVFAPNIWWNAQHHFVTFQHTEENVLTNQIELYPVETLLFLLAQFGLFGPLLLLALLRSLRTARRDAHTFLLHAFIWPLALTGVIVCFVAGAQAHWIAPTYTAGTVAVVIWLREHGRAHWLRYSLLLHLAILVLFYAAPTMLAQLPLQKNPLARVEVWNTLAIPVAQAMAQHPGAIVMTEERKIAAALTYQLRGLRGTQTPIAKWPKVSVRDQYDLISSTMDFNGKPILLVMREGNVPWQSQPNAQHLQTLTLSGYRFELIFIPAFVTPVFTRQ